MEAVKFGRADASRITHGNKGFNLHPTLFCSCENLPYFRQNIGSMQLARLDEVCAVALVKDPVTEVLRECRKASQSVSVFILKSDGSIFLRPDSVISSKKPCEHDNSSFIFLKIAHL